MGRVCGSVDEAIVPLHIQHIHTLNEFEGDLSKEDAQTFGTGLFEVLDDFIEKEFKYTRRDGLKILMPEFAGKHATLSKAVLGHPTRGQARDLQATDRGSFLTDRGERAA